MKKIVILTLSLAFLLSGCYTSSALDTEYDNGYENGYNSGYDDGYSAGYSDGENDGYECGYEYGHDDGYDEGYNDAYIEIYGEEYFDSSQETKIFGTDFDSTWGDMISANGGELVWGTLTPEQQALVNYPYLNPDEVFFVAGGDDYHSVEWCYTLQNSEDVFGCKLSLATGVGLDPCSKCVGE